MNIKVPNVHNNGYMYIMGEHIVGITDYIEIEDGTTKYKGSIIYVTNPNVTFYTSARKEEIIRYIGHAVQID